jgi:type IV secretion system protein TrbB
LDAWSTGHSGGGASVHSNSAAETLTRIQNMVGRVSVSPQQQTIVNAVNVVIYLKLHGSERYVEDIIEVDGYDEVQKKYLYHKIA